jgi:hypothetical protein
MRIDAHVIVKTPVSEMSASYIYPKKRRVCTTISAKHWDLLKKYSEKYETQQKVLELALESLDKTEKQGAVLTLEEQLWTRMGRELKVLCAIRRDLFLELMRTVDFEQFGELLNKLRLSEHQVISYYQKPLKECSLKEIMDGIVITCKVTNMYDSVTYTDDGNYYTLRVTHSCGSKNHTELIKIFLEPLFDAYGAKTQSDLYSNTLLMKIFKN